MLKDIISNGVVYSCTTVVVFLYLAITMIGLAFLGTLVYYLLA
ncbi:MAG TPA: hypothetical protein VHS59_01655 [Bacillota bacterium]|nr:hypothetical protein [Bacillota bacterium]